MFSDQAPALAILHTPAQHAKKVPPEQEQYAK